MTRVINACPRHGPLFQARIGLGLYREAFNARMREGRLGHVGLLESASMIFQTLVKNLTKH